jgi:hypothetical protein
MSGSALFVQPPGSVPIPMLADLDGQCYYATGGISRFVSIYPSLAGGSYAAGQCIGGLQNVSGVARAVGLGSGILYGATIIDPSRNAGQIDLLVFNPGVSGTFTDKTEAVVTSADSVLLTGSCHIVDWSIYGATTGCSVGNMSNAGLLYSCGKTGNVVGTTLQIVAVARAALTLAAGSGWRVNLKFLPD